MLSKRVFSNISNVNINTNDKIGQKATKAVKRALDLSPNKCLKKKNKSLEGQKTIGENDENESLEAIKCQTSDPTLSIERKVKAIDIGSKVRTRSATFELSSIPIEELSQTSDLSFEANAIDFSDPSTYYCPPIGIPHSIEDFDRSQLTNIDAEPHYAFDIFDYYRQRELKVGTKKYLQIQPELSRGMRSVLVDWMVEVQESFELNHETLYLSVKLIDQFLMKEKISKLQFQLVGATALLIAAKFDERIPPAIEDFLYICDDAYDRRDVILMEMTILKALNFDLCYPISYRFLRRYARCAKLSMETLTLARYVLEMSLMEYEIIEEADSRVAAAALLLALRMKGSYEWSETLEFYSGYREEELTILMYRLNDIICTQTKSKTIRTKYSHKIFFEVAKISPLPRAKMAKVIVV